MHEKCYVCGGRRYVLGGLSPAGLVRVKWNCPRCNAPKERRPSFLCDIVYCSACEGRGETMEMGEFIDCPSCHGEGSTLEWHPEGVINTLYAIGAAVAAALWFSVLRGGF